MPILTDIVQLTADNTNVFQNRIGAKAPKWARRCRLQLIFSDTDFLFSSSLGGEEMARDCGPHRSQADNVQQGDFTSPHLMKEIPPTGQDWEVLLNCNVVTAGVGLAVLQYES